MTRYLFKSPVWIWYDRRRPDFGTRPVEDVQAALAALHRFGLGEHRVDSRGRPRPEWERAAGALVRAKVEPTPETVEAARAAFETLARSAGALAPAMTPDPFSVFAPRWRFG